MNALVKLITDHGTKLLGFLGITVSVLAVADPDIVGGPRAIKYFLLAQSLLTVWRGFFNTANAETPPVVPAGKTGGFARVPMMLMVAALAVIAACAGTRQAYKEAGSVDETAYVVAEHYSSLVHEAADLKQAGGVPSSVVAAMQTGDKVANPAVHRLREARDAYLAVKNAKTEAELQLALNEAVGLVAQLSREVAQARGNK